LLACLPLHAEEGPIKERVPETVLVDAAGESTVSLVRRLFCAMALLDEQDLMATRPDGAQVVVCVLSSSVDRKVCTGNAG